MNLVSKKPSLNKQIIKRDLLNTTINLWLAGFMPEEIAERLGYSSRHMHRLVGKENRSVEQCAEHYKNRLARKRDLKLMGYEENKVDPIDVASTNFTEEDVANEVSDIEV